MNQTITIECPRCNLGQDIPIKDSEPIFDLYYMDAFKSCPQCGLILHLSLTGNEKELGGPF